MNQAPPKPAKQLDLSNVVISPLWAILISLLLWFVLCIFIYRNNPSV